MLRILNTFLVCCFIGLSSCGSEAKAPAETKADVKETVISPDQKKQNVEAAKASARVQKKIRETEKSVDALLKDLEN